MKTVSIKKHKYLFTFILLLTCINVWNVFTVSSMILEEDVEVGGETGWNGEEKALITKNVISPKITNQITKYFKSPALLCFLLEYIFGLFILIPPFYIKASANA